MNSKSNFKKYNQFKSTFDSDSASRMVLETRYYAFGFVVSYVVFSLTAQKLRKNKKAYKFDNIMLFWNSLLALLSCSGASNLFPELVNVIWTKGYVFSVCNNEFFSKDPSSLWNFVFVTSKLLEFGDTMFLILKKKPLSFWHLYYRSTSFFYVWYNYPNRISTILWYATITYNVRTIMYSHLVIKSLKSEIPKFISKFIVFLKLFEILTMITIMLTVILVNNLDGSPLGYCQQYDESAILGVLIFFSFFYLFLKSFESSYNETANKLE